MSTEQYWTKVHQNDYKDVWSLTQDPKALDMILDVMFDNLCHRTLVLGCGSRGILEHKIAEMDPWVQDIIATDFQGVIDCIKPNESHSPRVKYEARNSANLGYENYFDAIVVVNSILSHDHQENIDILKSCHKALNSKGILIAFFPTIFCSVDLMHTCGKIGYADLINLKENKFRDPNQNISQIFYTPLNLRKALRDTGFKLKTMEIAFFDSEHAISESKKHYGLQGTDDVVYEHFVVASKR